jgi:hypothetical protein
MPHPELVKEIKSYGEERRDLIALFVPFLAKHDFYDDAAISEARDYSDTATYRGPDGDFVGIRGRYNCIVITYYSTLKDPASRKRSAGAALDAYEEAIEAFVASLPSPKLAVRTLIWGTPACGTAT